ncbi:GNAT family N-acetyltransferase [Nocardia sp. NPDC049737]|uniref:GNAT family N-acetyltransferase n=1 Tax=Nocardia sp. NPDC049737 TaxID=3154358 RepID=UPI0034153B27
MTSLRQVDPRHQHRGIGTLIMDRIIDWATQRQLHHLGLAAHLDVAGFYKQGWDFEEAGLYLRQPRTHP